MVYSEKIENIVKALAKFQSEVTNPANTASNPYFNSRYAPLNEVLNLVRPLLTKNGLSIIQSPSFDGTNVTVTTIIFHESGEWIKLDPLTLKPDKNTPQGVGSAITYARRYALSAALGISSEDDDDGNSASGNQYNHKNKQTKTTSNETTKSKELLAIINEIDKTAKEKVETNKIDKNKLFEEIKKIAKTKNYKEISDVNIAKKVLEFVKNV